MRFAKLKTDGIDIYKQYTKKFIDIIDEANASAKMAIYSK